MKTRSICKIKGCTNMTMSKGRDKEGNQIFKYTCRSHFANGQRKYRHRGKQTTKAHKIKFNKRIN